MLSPQVSVIIPTHNRKELLKRAVMSVINQTFSDFEVIIVDDCSTDGTSVDDLGIDDERIRYLRTETCRGANFSRNLGVRASKGELICALDDDDEWLPNKLEKQIKKLQTAPSSVGLIYSGYYSVTEDGTTLSEVMPMLRGDVHADLLKRCVFGALTVMVKKQHILDVGLYDEKFKSCQDWDLWIRISKHCEVDFVPEPLAKYYIHGDQISTDRKKLIEGRLSIYEKYEDEISKHPRIKASHLLHISTLYLLDNNRHDGMHYLLRSIKSKPLQVWAYMHVIMSIFFPRMHLELLKRINTSTVGDSIIYS